LKQSVRFGAFLLSGLCVQLLPKPSG